MYRGRFVCVHITGSMEFSVWFYMTLNRLIYRKGIRPTSVLGVTEYKYISNCTRIGLHLSCK